jgi:hypothetical protein
MCVTFRLFIVFFSSDRHKYYPSLIFYRIFHLRVSSIPILSINKFVQLRRAALSQTAEIHQFSPNKQTIQTRKKLQLGALFSNFHNTFWRWIEKPFHTLYQMACIASQLEDAQLYLQANETSHFSFITSSQPPTMILWTQTIFLRSTDI